MNQYKLAVISGLVALGVAAQAAAIDLTTAYSGPNVYVANLTTAANGDFTPGNSTDSIVAGLVLASTTDGNRFYAYGIEPGVPLTKELTSYEITSYSAPLAVQQLYSGFYDRVVNPISGVQVAGDNIDEVAFQIALWELANDNGNLASGSLSFGGVTDAATLPFVARAQFFLTNLPTVVTTEYTFTRYTAANVSGIGGATIGSQDLLRATAVTAVPEPAAWALMLCSLASLGFVSRRRKQD